VQSTVFILNVGNNKMKTITLDYYLDKNSQAMIGFFGFGFLVGVFNGFEKGSFIEVLLFSILLIISILLIVTKKALTVSDSKLYNTLRTINKTTRAIQIEVDNFSHGEIEQLNKKDPLPFMFGPLSGMLSEYDAFKLILLNENENNKKEFLRFSDFDQMIKAVAFIEENTSLTIRKEIKTVANIK
jgi:uncharacterized membrane protein